MILTKNRDFPMASGTPVLDINDLHAGIDDTPILRGINLTIPSGEIHAIMGRNGSGKTTTANIIMGHPCLLYTSPSPRDKRQSRMPSSA